MKRQVSKLSPRPCAAFSFSEFTVAMAVFFLVAAGLITSYIFGLKMYEITRAKLGASADSRKAITYMVGEIRSANRVRIGDGSRMAFSDRGATNEQKGNAIQIHATTNLNDFVRYYWESNSATLRRITNTGTNYMVIVNDITNTVVFTAEDFRGTILTNSRNNRVIGVDLAFSQVPFAKEYSDYYRLRFKVTRRRLR